MQQTIQDTLKENPLELFKDQLVRARSFGRESLAGMNPTWIALQNYISIDQLE